MQQLNIEELLRYGIAGVFAFMAPLIMFQSFKLPLSTTSVGPAGILAAVALAIGALVYAFHRAILYPLLYRLVVCVLCVFRVYRFDNLMLFPLLPTNLDLSLDFLRWKRAKEENFAQSSLSHWGAQVHFLYCSSWSVLFVRWFGIHLGLRVTDAEPFVLWGAVTVAAAAFASNCRLAYYEARLVLVEHPELRP